MGYLLVKNIDNKFYSREQRAERMCLHIHSVTAARVESPQLSCITSLMPRQFAAGDLTYHKWKI